MDGAAIIGLGNRSAAKMIPDEQCGAPNATWQVLGHPSFGRACRPLSRPGHAIKAAEFGIRAIPNTSYRLQTINHTGLDPDKGTPAAMQMAFDTVALARELMGKHCPAEDAHWWLLGQYDYSVPQTSAALAQKPCTQGKWAKKPMRNPLQSARFWLKRNKCAS